MWKSISRPKFNFKHFFYEYNKGPISHLSRPGLPHSVRVGAGSRFPRPIEKPTTIAQCIGNPKLLNNFNHNESHSIISTVAQSIGKPKLHNNFNHNESFSRTFLVQPPCQQHLTLCYPIKESKSPTPPVQRMLQLFEDVIYYYTCTLLILPRNLYPIQRKKYIVSNSHFLSIILTEVL